MIYERLSAGQLESAYTQYFKPLLRFVGNRLGNFSEAQDIVHDTYVKAAGGEFRNKGYGIRPWLYRIAHNTLIDYLRARYPVEQLKDSEDLVVLTNRGPSVEEIVEKNIRSQRLRAVIETKLTRREQDMVNLHLEGFSDKDIAYILACGEPAVGKILFKARKKIRKSMTENISVPGTE